MIRNHFHIWPKRDSSKGRYSQIFDGHFIPAVLISVLIMAIFFTDWMSPLGYADWLLYIIPLTLTSSNTRLNSFLIATVITIFIVVGYFLSPLGINQDVAFVNRSLGIMTVWVIAIILTQHKQAKSSAEVLTEHASMLFEASIDPLVTISTEGMITGVNKAFIRSTGMPREQIIGTDFSNLFTEPVIAQKVYQKALSDGLVRDCSLSMRHVDGSNIEVLYNASIFKDEIGNTLGIFGVARDVTQQKILNQQLQDKNAELENSKIAAESANLAKSDFLSHMSHELRSPLNAILGFSQMLETGEPSLTHIQMARLNEILKAGWYLLSLINEILDLALIESGKASITLEPIMLSKTLFECQTMIEPQAIANGINLSVLLPDSTWFVRADQTKLKQVVTNLLTNAIKYNRVNGTVDVSCSKSTLGRLRICVKDNGFGLSDEKKAQLFQPFNRLGQEVGVKEGVGIGLAVCKKLVDMMGGTIGVESTVGVGSEFWIEFDRDDNLQTTALISFPEKFSSQLKDEAELYTMLYVEDSPANLMLVEHIIMDYPHIRMLSAVDGTSAITIAKEQFPDIILMDINLPGISGIETMFLLRKDSVTKDIPIIALSANAMPRDIKVGMEAGFFSYLTKPIKNNELVEALDAAIISIRNK